MTAPAAPAAPALRPIPLGRHAVWPPVVLAPMAGVTNVAYRRLCREYGGGLFVSEMTTSRALVERNDKTMRMLAFHRSERPRSLQLYGVDPVVVGEAVRIVVAEDRADHVDLNFGCPVPKVTRRGGGAALPWKRRRFTAVVRAAVRAAAPSGVPVTVKLRTGIDDGHLTYRDAGRFAADEGAAWVALHGRTAEQHYSGRADWSAIADLVARLDVPVLGNGDIWTADDARRMVAETGCAGVVVGRGCLGRPWLFAELAAALTGQPVPPPPDLGEVVRVLRRHADLLAEHLGTPTGLRELRKHVAWYLKGFSVPQPVRAGLAQVSTYAELDDLLARVDVEQAAPLELLAEARGRTGSPRRVLLPDGWLDDPDSPDAALDLPLEPAVAVSGG